MFAHATSSSSSGMAVPIVTSLTQYLLSLPLFSLCESSNASVLEHGSLSPDIIQLAMDNLIKMVEPFMENEKEVLSSLHSALLELLLLLSLQRGSVSGALRVCRFLLRHPNGGVSSPVVEWLKQHAQSLRLSVEAAGGRGGGDGAQHARAIASDFWRRRRGEGRDGHLRSASVATGLMPFADVWSSVFGYLCCLHYCQRLLREQRKALHIQDTHEHALRATLGRPTPTAMRHVQAVSRGLGSSYFALSFVVDSFISFTLREVSIVMLQSEAFPRRIEELGSGVELCRALDQLLVELQGVCFRAEPPACEAPAQPSMASASVRTAINLVLALVLTDTRLPVALVHGRARNAIEALVAVISTLNGAEPLKRRLSPLLAMLTFNRYYGESDGGSYQFR